MSSILSVTVETYAASILSTLGDFLLHIDIMLRWFKKTVCYWPNTQPQLFASERLTDRPDTSSRMTRPSSSHKMLAMVLRQVAARLMHPAAVSQAPVLPTESGRSPTGEIAMNWYPPSIPSSSLIFPVVYGLFAARLCFYTDIGSNHCFSVGEGPKKLSWTSSK